MKAERGYTGKRDRMLYCGNEGLEFVVETMLHPKGGSKSRRKVVMAAKVLFKHLRTPDFFPRNTTNGGGKRLKSERGDRREGEETLGGADRKLFDRGIPRIASREFEGSHNRTMCEH